MDIVIKNIIITVNIHFFLTLLNNEKYNNLYTKLYIAVFNCVHLPKERRVCKRVNVLVCDFNIFFCIENYCNIETIVIIIFINVSHQN